MPFTVETLGGRIVAAEPGHRLNALGGELLNLHR